MFIRNANPTEESHNYNYVLVEIYLRVKESIHTRLYMLVFVLILEFILKILSLFENNSFAISKITLQSTRTYIVVFETLVKATPKKCYFSHMAST